MLTLPNLESLEVVCPNEEEVSSVKGYDGDVNLLANPEKFISELIKVKGFAVRIKGLKFRQNYEELFAELEKKIVFFKSTFDALEKNPWIPKILEYCLGVGNYLNGQSARGGAWGFKLEQVEKISDVKAADNKSNLLMYVIDKIEQTYKVIEGDSELEPYD